MLRYFAGEGSWAVDFGRRALKRGIIKTWGGTRVSPKRANLTLWEEGGAGDERGEVLRLRRLRAERGGACADFFLIYSGSCVRISPPGEMTGRELGRGGFSVPGKRFVKVLLSM